MMPAKGSNLRILQHHLVLVLDHAVVIGKEEIGLTKVKRREEILLPTDSKAISLIYHRERKKKHVYQ